MMMLLGLALPAGCRTAQCHPYKPDADTTCLRVGVTANYPPVIFREGDQISGMEAQMAAKLAERLDRVLEFVEMPWGEQIPALLGGKVDIIMSGMSITRERMARISFCEPYLEVGQLALYRAEDADRYQNPLGVVLSEGRIGVEQGTTGESFVRHNCKKATCVPYSSARQAAEALTRGRLDLVVADAPVVWYLAGELSDQGLTFAYTPLTQEYLAWAVHPANRALLAAANQAIAEWKDDGTLQEMIHQWLPLAR